jgi:hypothetical protein
VLALIVKVYKYNNSPSPHRRLDIDQIAIAAVVWSGRSNLLFPLMVESFGARAVLPHRQYKPLIKP